MAETAQRKSQRILFVRRTVATVSACIAITNIEPEGAIISQDAPDFGENIDEFLDVFVRLCFRSDLALYPVVSESSVGRRGYAALKEAIWESAQNLGDIPFIDSRFGHLQAVELTRVAHKLHGGPFPRVYFLHF